MSTVLMSAVSASTMLTSTSMWEQGGKGCGLYKHCIRACPKFQQCLCQVPPMKTAKKTTHALRQSFKKVKPCLSAHSTSSTTINPEIGSSIGEVQSGPVPGHFCQTGDQTVQSLMKYLGPGPGTATNRLYRSDPGPDRVQTVPALFIYLFIQD